MAITTTIKWSEPCVWIDYGDGVLMGESIEVIRTDDIRETPIGQFNFGSVKFGRRKFVRREAMGE